MVAALGMLCSYLLCDNLFQSIYECYYQATWFWCVVYSYLVKRFSGSRNSVFVISDSALFIRKHSVGVIFAEKLILWNFCFYVPIVKLNIRTYSNISF